MTDQYLRILVRRGPIRSKIVPYFIYRVLLNDMDESADFANRETAKSSTICNTREYFRSLGKQGVRLFWGERKSQEVWRGPFLYYFSRRLSQIQGVCRNFEKEPCLYHFFPETLHFSLQLCLQLIQRCSNRQLRHIARLAQPSLM